jgi:hypothetical protein
MRSIVKKAKFPVFPIHDCFLIPERYENHLKRLYNKELKKIYNSSIFNIFEINKISNYRDDLTELYNSIKLLIPEPEKYTITNKNSLKKD